MSKRHIKRVSSDDLESLEDRTRADAPEGESLGPDFWKSARVVHPEGPKERITVRLDRHLVA